MRLVDANNDQCFRVTGLSGEQGMENKLRQLGLQPGDRIRVVRHAPFGGPIMVEINGRTIALGRGVAAKIAVELERGNI